ncbi:Hypothetical protein POVN_LOCUS41 [uncultured virus]|nr:Hypothetical protein POVN_LOCUS41 [uncultured virus]
MTTKLKRAETAVTEARFATSEAWAKWRAHIKLTQAHREKVFVLKYPKDGKRVERRVGAKPLLAGKTAQMEKEATRLYALVEAATDREGYAELTLRTLRARLQPGFLAERRVINRLRHELPLPDA